LKAEDPKPDSTAVRVALWRALHLAVDAQPPILEDTIGLQLAAPEEDWRTRPDMNPLFTKTFRAAIVARARFIEDLVAQEAKSGVGQYVLLGAGLDSFAQRRPDLAVTVFEVDQPGTQAWKRKRLMELGFGVQDRLRLVPVDLEHGGSWWDELMRAGFDAGRPAVAASTGVSLYLTKDANRATLRRFTALAPGSTMAMSFILPPELASPGERPGFEAAIRGARASGTPFVSFFTPEEMLAMAGEAGFKDSRIVSGEDLARRYFANRTDGFRPGGSEALLVART
jgi:methyltransferase (TIGR00027 family)